MNVNLPIYQHRERIIKSVKDNKITIIQSETGSGKSTQVPQYLYESGYEVIVTEPRRLAAIMLADRVYKEIGDEKVVGYHTAFESNKTRDTKILFCTDGLQLVKSFISGISKNTILVIDEVHEWNLNIETLVAWVKKCHNENKDLKVILMSATIDSVELCNYFGEGTNIVNVEGRNYDVVMKEANEDELYRYIKDNIYRNNNILVFMPGKKEINDVITEVKRWDLDVIVLPLHGTLNIEEQNKCFNTYDKVKIVVATNVAQTWITIPDIDVVIDVGLERRTELRNGIEGLFLHEISKVDCEQRRGRAGRTKNGGYILCSRTKYKDREEYPIAEINRASLDQVVLRLAFIGIDAEDVEFFHQPGKRYIREAKDILTKIGALDKDGITYIGVKMAKMPLSSKYARMLVEAEKLGVVEEVITATAIMELGGLLSTGVSTDGSLNEPRYKKGTNSEVIQKVNYKDLVDEETSDILAELKLWNKAQNMSVPDMKMNGFGIRKFFKIVELRSKIIQVATGVIEFTTGGNEEDILFSCLSGFVDNIYFLCNSFRQTYFTDNYNRKYYLNNNSCIKDRIMMNTNIIVIGISRIVESVNSYGLQYEKNIVQMASIIDVKSIIKRTPELLTVNSDYCQYIPEEDCCNRIKEYKIQGVTVYREYYKDYSSAEFYKAKEEYLFKISGHTISELEELTKQKVIIVNENVYNIEYDVKGKPSVIIPEEELINITIPSLYLNNGNKVKVMCKYYTPSTEIINIKRSIDRHNVNEALDEFKARLPKKTGKIENIIEYIKCLGKREVYTYVADGEKEYLYTGLSIDGNSVKVSIFDEEETAYKSTVDALRCVLSNEVMTKYGNKKFKIRANGKTIETKGTGQAREEFMQYANLAIEEISVDNFKESIEFIEQMYNEIMERLGLICSA